MPYHYHYHHPYHRTSGARGDLPPVRGGLLFFAPLTPNYGTTPLVSVAGTSGLSVQTVDADGTFVRSGVLQQATLNTARLEDYGVRIDPTRVNSVLQSRNLDAGSLSGTLDGIVITANQATSVWGTTTADKITEDASTGLHYCFGAHTLVAATTYTLSIMAKVGAGRSWVFLYANDTSSAIAHFNISTGAVGTVAGTWSPSASISSWGGGWYRCALTFVASGSGDFNCGLGMAEADNDLQWAGDNVSYCNVSDCQLEAGANASGVIPTAGASVTRTVDSLTYPTAGNMLAATGTLHVLLTPGAATQTAYALDWSADGDNEFHLDLNAGVPRFTIERATAQQAQLSSSAAVALATPAVVSMCWGANDVRLYVNGADAKSDASATMPSSINASLFLGTDIAGANAMVGDLGYIIIYSVAQTAAEVLLVSNWIRAKMGL